MAEDDTGSHEDGAEQWAADIRRLLSEDNVGSALTKSLGFAREFGSERDLYSAVALNARLRRVERSVLDFGSTPDDLAERNRVLAAALTLIDDVLGYRRSRFEPRAQTSPIDPAARDAFTRGRSSRESVPRAREVVLRCAGLGKTRRIDDPAFALAEISFELRVGEILGVVGVNGQGKSTLLDLLSGRLAHDCGELDFPFASGDWAMIKRSIAYIPQAFQADFDVTDTALRFIAGLYGSIGTDNDLVVGYTLARLGLEQHRTVRAATLSRGFQVRFALARALLKRPRLLLLDEPLAHLDIPTQTRFLADVVELSRSTANPFAVVVSSQHLHEVEAVADRLLLLRNGRIHFHGTPQDIRTKRDFDIFEIGCAQDRTKVAAALAHFGGCSVDRRGETIVIQCPRSFSSAHLLKQLIAAGIDLHYYRDLSSSVRSMLEDIAK